MTRCLWCGKRFHKKRSEQLLCSRNCSFACNAYAHMSTLRNSPISFGVERWLKWARKQYRRCAGCGEPLIGKTLKRCRQCTLEAARRRSRIQYVPSRHAGEIVCEFCKLTVVVEMRAQTRKYCATCGKRVDRLNENHRARAHKAGVPREPVNIADLVRSHGWTCYLCGLGIDPTLPAADPMSANVDHKVPLCAGGAHTLSNLGLTHRRCNEAKGKRLPSEL